MQLYNYSDIIRSFTSSDDPEIRTGNSEPLNFVSCFFFLLPQLLIQN